MEKPNKVPGLRHHFGVPEQNTTSSQMLMKKQQIGAIKDKLALGNFQPTTLTVPIYRGCRAEIEIKLHECIL